MIDRRQPRSARVRRRVVGAASAVIALAALLGSCKPTPPVDPPPTTTTTTTTTVPMGTRLCRAAPPVQSGSLQGTVVDELSGLAASRTAPGIFWGHNDNGDTPRIFGIAANGAVRATVAITNAQAVDWEDIAIQGSTIYIGDIGGNVVSRSSVVVYRVEEPALSATSTVADAAYTLRYPDGPHDAEALMIDPVLHSFVIVTKAATGNSGVYVAPLDASGDLQRVAGLTLGNESLVTAGDISTTGDLIALRTYNRVLVWTRRGNESIAAAFSRAPCDAPVHAEHQSEALALLPAGNAYLTSGEGVGAAIWVVAAGA